MQSQQPTLECPVCQGTLPEKAALDICVAHQRRRTLEENSIRLKREGDKIIELGAESVSKVSSWSCESRSAVLQYRYPSCKGFAINEIEKTEKCCREHISCHMNFTATIEALEVIYTEDEKFDEIFWRDHSIVRQQVIDKLWSSSTLVR